MSRFLDSYRDTEYPIEALRSRDWAIHIGN